MAGDLLDTRHLVLVQAIAEEGSVTRAALRLHISQPALSHALAEVESRLGAQLFARSRGMTPTSAGERVLATAARVLEELDVLRQSLSGPAASSAVRVSTSCYTAYPWLPTVLAELSRAMRPIELRIVLEATRVPLQALARRSIDLALTTERPSRRDLLVAHLFDDELVAIVSPTHALAARKYVTPAELAGERLLVYDAPLASLDVWRMFFVLRACGPATWRESR
jgi:LysR family transcriptional regulator for metE and metH